MSPGVLSVEADGDIPEFQNSIGGESPINTECYVSDVSILNSKQLLLKDKLSQYYYLILKEKGYQS